MFGRNWRDKNKKKKHDERHERIHTPAAMRVKGGHYGIHYILLLGKGFNS